MKNLGEKLHEARVARGVTLRDAADMTKIRIDFLQNMEDGNFDFDLPEVYKRGFIRLYAQFLRLDPKAIHDEYVKLSAAQFRKDQRRGDLGQPPQPLRVGKYPQAERLTGQSPALIADPRPKFPHEGLYIGAARRR